MDDWSGAEILVVTIVTAVVLFIGLMHNQVERKEKAEVEWFRAERIRKEEAEAEEKRRRLEEKRRRQEEEKRRQEEEKRRQEEEVRRKLEEEKKKRDELESRHFQGDPKLKEEVFRWFYTYAMDSFVKGEGEAIPSSDERVLRVKYRLNVRSDHGQLLSKYLWDLNLFFPKEPYFHFYNSSFYREGDLGCFIALSVDKTSDPYRERCDHIDYERHFRGRTEDTPESQTGPRSSNPTIKRLLYQKQSGVCEGCGIKFPERNLEIDHIVPLARGGPNIDTNLQLLCGACNRAKSAKPMSQLKAKLKADGII